MRTDFGGFPKSFHKFTVFLDRHSDDIILPGYLLWYTLLSTLEVDRIPGHALGNYYSASVSFTVKEEESNIEI